MSSLTIRRYYITIDYIPHTIFHTHKHTFSKDLLHARYLGEFWGVKDALSPCPQAGYKLGTKRFIATRFKLLPLVRHSVQGFPYIRSLSPPKNTSQGRYNYPWSQSWVKPSFIGFPDCKAHTLNHYIIPNPHPGCRTKLSGHRGYHSNIQPTHPPPWNSLWFDSTLGSRTDWSKPIWMTSPSSMTIGSRTRLKPISTRHARMCVWMGLTDLIREKLRTLFWSLWEGSFFLYKCGKAWGVVTLGSHLARRKKDSLHGVNSRRGQRWGYSKEGGRAWKTMPEAYLPLRFSFMWVKGSSLVYKVSLFTFKGEHPN